MAEKQRNDKESVAKKQYELDNLRIGELSLKQERNPTTVSQLVVTQIQDLPQGVNYLSDREVYADTASSSGASHVPQPLIIPSRRV